MTLWDPRDRAKLAAPYGWRKLRDVLVTDLFEPSVPDGQVLDAIRVMIENRPHRYEIRTAHTDRVRAWFARWNDVEPVGDPLMVRGPAAVRAAYTSQRAMLFAEMLDGWGEPPEGSCFPTFDWAEGMRWWPLAWPGETYLRHVRVLDIDGKEIEKR